MLPCECCCDDKKVRDLEKKVNKAVYSVAVNGEIIYPNDGVGNVNLGDIGGSTDARDIKMPDGTSVAVAIEETQNDLADKVSDVIPTPVTAGINLNETDGNGTVSRMLIRADDTLKFDGLNVGISEATDARITQAQDDATTAGTKADDAQADADTAQATADVAVKTLDTTKIIGDTTTLQLNVEKNNGNKGIIQLLADSDDIDMSDSYGAGATVLKLKDTLKEKINGAISTIGAGVVDSALEMNIEKADGTTATEPLFSIGDGLEWSENVLKATGGSSAGMKFITGDASTYQFNNGDIIFFDGNVNEMRFTNLGSALNITSGTYGSYGNIPNTPSVYTAITAPHIVFFGIYYDDYIYAYFIVTSISGSTTMDITCTHEGTSDIQSLNVSYSAPSQLVQSIHHKSTWEISCPLTQSIEYEGLRVSSSRYFTMAIYNTNITFGIIPAQTD